MWKCLGQDIHHCKIIAFVKLNKLEFCRLFGHVQRPYLIAVNYAEFCGNDYFGNALIRGKFVAEDWKIAAFSRRNFGNSQLFRGNYFENSRLFRGKVLKISRFFVDSRLFRGLLLKNLVEFKVDDVLRVIQPNHTHDPILDLSKSSVPKYISSMQRMWSGFKSFMITLFWIWSLYHIVMVSNPIGVRCCCWHDPAR